MKSYFSSKVGKISSAFPHLTSIIVSIHTSSKLAFAFATESGENSIVVIFPPFFCISIAKLIVEYQFAIPTSSKFFAHLIFTKSLKNLALVSVTFGISFATQ
jgi:hypothetical protein